MRNYSVIAHIIDYEKFLLKYHSVENKFLRWQIQLLIT